MNFFKKYANVFIPVTIVGLIFWFFIAVAVGGTNPESVFCNYKIYKQEDGTYQVWWRCKTSHIELQGATYEQAKAFQIKACRDLEMFVLRKPKGERVK